MIIILKNKDTLHVDDFTFKCSIGKKGLTSKKIEGDKKTPKGIFKLDKLYYRKDRHGKPETKLQCKSIKNNMGWCNDVRNPKNYNKLITKNKNDQEILDLIDDFILDFKEQNNLRKIESLEKKLINNLDENSYSELVKLKNQLNRD